MKQGNDDIDPGPELLTAYLRATQIIDADHPDIKAKAEEVTRGQTSPIEKAMSMFYFVRDGIHYNPYVPRDAPEHFRASVTLARKEGFCIQKAALLAALCRAQGIPARLGFAVIRNHLLPDKVAQMLTGKEITDHGYAELLLGDKWVKATVVFDSETCRKHRYKPIEFEGLHDATFHRYTLDGLLHIEYVEFRGHYVDVPVKAVNDWIAEVLTEEGRKVILGLDQEGRGNC